MSKEASPAAGSEFVTIASKLDGFTFVVPRRIAMASGTLTRMLDEEANFAEAKTNTCELEYRGVILLKVIEYLAYKVQYTDTSAADIREDFADRIDPYIALELGRLSRLLTSIVGQQQGPGQYQRIQQQQQQQQGYSQKFLQQQQHHQQPPSRARLASA